MAVGQLRVIISHMARPWNVNYLACGTRAAEGVGEAQEVSCTLV
jgi:hypothetical protein